MARASPARIRKLPTCMSRCRKPRLCRHDNTSISAARSSAVGGRPLAYSNASTKAPPPRPWPCRDGVGTPARPQGRDAGSFALEVALPAGAEKCLQHQLAALDFRLGNEASAGLRAQGLRCILRACRRGRGPDPSGTATAGCGRGPRSAPRSASCHRLDRRGRWQALSRSRARAGAARVAARHSRTTVRPAAPTNLPSPA